MSIRQCAAVLACSLPALLLAGCPSCPYDTRCDGDVLLFCSVGVDQMVGSPSKTSRACVAPNPVCVDLDERTAQCAMDASSACDLEFVPRCEGGLLVGCTRGKLVAEDCVGHGNACFELAAGPRCAQDPLTACDNQDYTTHCFEDLIVACTAGYVQIRHCGLDRPNGTCQEYENEYGRGAYCIGD
jgi:hypothetical protein